MSLQSRMLQLEAQNAMAMDYPAASGYGVVGAGRRRRVGRPKKKRGHGYLEGELEYSNVGELEGGRRRRRVHRRKRVGHGIVEGEMAYSNLAGELMGGRRKRRVHHRRRGHGVVGAGDIDMMYDTLIGGRRHRRVHHRRRMHGRGTAEDITEAYAILAAEASDAGDYKEELFWNSRPAIGEMSETEKANFYIVLKELGNELSKSEIKAVQDAAAAGRDFSIDGMLSNRRRIAKQPLYKKLEKAEILQATYPGIPLATLKAIANATGAMKEKILLESVFSQSPPVTIPSVVTASATPYQKLLASRKLYTLT